MGRASDGSSCLRSAGSPRNRRPAVTGTSRSASSEPAEPRALQIDHRTRSAEILPSVLSNRHAPVRTGGERPARDRRRSEEEKAMTQYLIGMYQPDGVVPPPEFLSKVMADLG